MHWEYQVINNPTPLKPNLLEAISYDRWELITILKDHDFKFDHYFKRPIEVIDTVLEDIDISGMKF